jgi:hypothetical protein
MSLTFDYTTVANIKNFDDEMHKSTSQFAWVMSAIRMNEINANNVDSPYIRSMIGYKTNVRTETRNAYMRSIMRTVEDTVKGLDGFDA